MEASHRATCGLIFDLWTVIGMSLPVCIPNLLKNLTFLLPEIPHVWELLIYPKQITTKSLIVTCKTILRHFFHKKRGKKIKVQLANWVCLENGCMYTFLVITIE